MTPEAIINGTPVWVWVLLAVLLARGIKSLQSRTSQLSRIAIVPLMFAGWGIIHLVTDPLAGWSAVLAWALCALGGVLGGVYLASRTRFIVDPFANTVMLPGSIVPLVLIIAAFATKFWLGVEVATVTDVSALTTYTVIDAAVSGVIAGLFAGRFLCYWRAMSRTSRTAVSW